ncbi:MAG: hypothetical protein WCK55_18195 [Verrucomicrobiota bacterium]
MNPRVLPLFALLAAIAAVAWFFLSSGPSPSAGNATPDPKQAAQTAAAYSGGTAKKSPATGNSSAVAGKKTTVDWNRFGMLTGGSGALPEPTAEDIARFLAKNGETPANLVTAFEKTHDRRWLERALELFPGSPVVLMAALESIGGASPRAGETYQPDPQRMAYIDRFKAADPNNPLPWIFSAQEFFNLKQTADALAEVRAALGRPAFYTYATERMDSAQKLYESLGLGPVEASALAMFGLTIPHTTAAMQSSRSLMELQKSASQSGDTAAADEALRLTYDLGRTFATPEASRMLIGQLVGIGMEKRALEALPAGSPPDWLKVNPAERLAEIEQKKAYMQGFTNGIESVIRNQDGELLAEYLRRMRTESEAAAYEWLKKQKR